MAKKKKRPEPEREDVDFENLEEPIKEPAPEEEIQEEPLEEDPAEIDKEIEVDEVAEVEEEAEADEEATEELASLEDMDEVSAGEGDADGKQRTAVKTKEKTALLDDEEAAVREEAAEEEIEEKEIAEAEEEIAEEGAAEGDQVDKPETPAEEEEKPRSMVTLLTMILAVFNILAACGFAFLLLMNHQKRHDWEFANFMHDLALDGLQLQEQYDDEELRTASEFLRPPVNVSPSQIAGAFKKRQTGISIPDKEFQEVNEVLRTSIKLQKLSDEKRKAVLTTLFAPLSKSDEPGQPVKTLEEEVIRVKGKLLADIAAAAKQGADAAQTLAADKQREQLKKILLPMAYTTQQIEAAAKEIDTADDKSLYALREDAVQRKMLYDLIRIVQMYRHWDLKEPLLEQAVGPGAVPLKTFQEQAKLRLEDLLKKDTPFNQSVNSQPYQRESYEKRANIGFVLATVANLRVPPGGVMLYPRETFPNSKKLKPTRAEVVLGLVEYVKSVNVLAGVVKKINDTAQEKVAADRDGIALNGGKSILPGFVEDQKTLVKYLTGMVGDIEARKVHIKEVEKQLDTSKKQLMDRDLFYASQAKLLENALKDTGFLVKKLKNLETQLFAAQMALAGIMEVNEQLERQIAAAETKLIGPKKKK